MLRDLAQSARRLGASPLFSLFVIVTLAVGIGVTTAIYSIVRVVSGPPAGVRDPASIVNVYGARHASLTMSTLSWPDYQDFVSRQTTLGDVAAWAFTRQAFTANGRAETAFGELVDGAYFQLLGVNAAAGRMLQAADSRQDAPAVAVISDRVWKRVFDASPAVVGRMITMNGHAFEIVGVAPAAFRGLFNNGFIPTAIWVPISAVRLLPQEGYGFTLDPAGRDRRWLLVKGRLRNGGSLASVQAEVSTIARQLDHAYPSAPRQTTQGAKPVPTERDWMVRSAADVIVNENADRAVRPLIVTLLAAVALVLLVACTNVANLTLARNSDRRQESAIRLALGATRWQLLRNAAAETAILSLLGGLGGLAVARVLVIAIGNDLDVGNGASLHVEPVIDRAVLAGSAVATMLALIVAALLPAWQASRVDVRSGLASGGGGPAPRWRGRRLLITGQVTVSLVLLTVAALCVNALQQANLNDSGADIEHLALVDVDFGLQKYEEPRVRQIVDAVLSAVSSRPDVRGVAASSGLPFGISTPGGSLRTSEHPQGVRVELLASTPAFTRTLGVQMIRGRSLDAADRAGSRRVAVVSERAARDLFETNDAVGRTAVFQRSRWAGMPESIDEPVTIVGVAADTDAGGWGRRDHGAVYLPLAQHHERHLVVSARTSGDPAPLVGVLLSALRGVDPNVAVSQSGTGLTLAGPSTLFATIAGSIAGLLGSFALALAMVGLFGALSHVISRRTAEIGIRLALGATKRQVTRMVLFEGLRPVLYGVTMGLLLGAIARMALRPYFVRLFPALDPFLLGAVPVLFVITALVACYLPARQAASVDPSVALRNL